MGPLYITITKHNMQRKHRIAVLGIGGVGGFIGAKLAAAYRNTEDVEVLFIARGENARVIKEQGLRLKDPSGELVVRPDRIVEDLGSAGAIDLLLCCTKSYDLESSIRALSASLTPDTIILPLLNGIDAAERIRSVQPGAKVLQGCIYIVSKRMAPGIVQQSGEFHSLHLGGDGIAPREAEYLTGLFQRAGVNAVWEENIREKIWAKFSFISPLATYTSAHIVTIGEILGGGEHVNALEKLMLDLGALAQRLNVHLAGDFVEKNFAVMRQLPAAATSSMQADFANGRPTELETLTGVVVKKAAEHSIRLNAYPELYELLQGRRQNVSV